MLVLQKIKKSLTKDKERLPQAQSMEENQQTVDDPRDLNKDKKHAGTAKTLKKDKKHTGSGSSLKKDKEHAGSGPSLKKDKKHASSEKSLKKDKQSTANVQNIPEPLHTNIVAEVKVSTPVTTVQPEEKRQDADKSAVNGNGTIVSTQNNLSSLRIVAVLQAPSLPRDASPNHTLHSPAERLQKVSASILLPDIFAPETLLAVAEQIVNQTGNSALHPGANFITHGEAFLVQASTTCQFFKNCRDVFFSSKNRDGHDGFSKNVFKKAEDQFKQIRSQHITLGKSIADAVIKPMNAAIKEKMTRLLVQMRWAASAAYSTKERYHLYDLHLSYYHSLKGCWGVSYEETKELQIELEGLLAELHQHTNAIDENILTPEHMRKAKFREFEKLYQNLKDDENKRLIINETLSVIEQFKVDVIIDAIAKKIQLQKVIYKDEPLAPTRNKSNNKYKIEFDIDMIVKRIEQLKKDPSIEQPYNNASKQKRDEFNSLIDGAIKRLQFLKLDPTGQVYISNALLPTDPALDAVLDDVVKKLSHLRYSFLHLSPGQDTALLNDFHIQLNEYQKLWQSRLQELNEKSARYTSSPLQAVI